MKRNVLPVLLALCLLSGCASMLDRSYLSITPHAEHMPAEGDTPSPQAENYQGLVNAILYCVTQGQEHSVIRLVNYTRDVEADLAAACLEVVQDDPLGSYAVDYIKHTWKRIVSYYEVELEVTYRRTQEQVAKIITATGSNAIRTELRGALLNFSPELVLRISAFSEDEAYIETLLREAYYSTPAAALGMPKLEIAVHPDSGAQRIVEILLEYRDSAETLRKQSAALSAAAVDLATRIPDGELIERLEQIYTLLRAKAQYLPEVPDGDTGYAVLLGGEADSEGFALANELVTSAVGVRSIVVRGTLEGRAHCWNIILRDEGNLHLDITRDAFACYDDAALAELGYEWDTAFYPVCVTPEPEEDPEQTQGQEGDAGEGQGIAP